MATETIETEEKEMTLDDLVEDIGFGIISHELGVCVNENLVFGKPVLLYDGINDKKIAKSYWLLDKNAFGSGQPAPVFMKLDALILGGVPIIMTLPIDKADPSLVEELEASELENIPIGFMDLHYKGKGKFTVSGLGIAKKYQGKGLGKLMIYGGVKVAGVKELIIPTQLSNAIAHYAWMHLAPLEMLSADVFHNEPDTIIYKTTIPYPNELILQNHSRKSNLLLPFNQIKDYCSQNKQVNVVGYKPGVNGGLFIE